MRMRLFLFVLLLPVLAIAQGPVQRTPLTTNTMMNSPADGWGVFWNDTAKKWSNAVIAASATNAQPPSTILTNISSTGAITNIDEGNKVYVQTNGNNSTGARGRKDKPFLSVSNALAAAVAGDTLILEPGTHYIPTNTTTLFKNGVNWFLLPGANLTAGAANHTNQSYLFHDIGGAVTCTIGGYGRFFMTNNSGPSDGTKMFYLSNASSSVTIVGLSARIVGGYGTLLTGSAGTLTYAMTDYSRADGYDLFITGGNQFFCNVYSAKNYAGGSFVEGYGSLAPGQQVFDLPYCELLAGGQGGNAFQIPDWMYVKAPVINMLAAESNIQGVDAGDFPEGTGVLEGNVIWGYQAASTYGVIQRRTDQTTYTTALTLKGYTIYGPTGLDPIFLQGDEGKLTLDNVRIVSGANATNSIRATNAQTVVLKGPLYADKGFSSSVVRESGTNYLTAIDVQGTLKATNGAVQIGQNSFPITFGNVDGSVDPGGGIMTNRYAIYQRGQFLMNDSGQSVDISSGAFMQFGADSYLRLVGKADPTITTAGQLTFDTDAYGASLGAFFMRDGTRSNLLVAVDATDVPSNGQVVKFNTGGRLTWEDDTGAGGGEANVNGEASVTNATRIGLVNGKASITNLLRSIEGGNGVALTNQGTNVMIAVDTGVVATMGVANTFTAQQNFSANINQTAGSTFVNNFFVNGTTGEGLILNLASDESPETTDTLMFRDISESVLNEIQFASFPISTAQQNALNLKAPLDGPTFTSVVTVNSNLVFTPRPFVLGDTNWFADGSRGMFFTNSHTALGVTNFFVTNIANGQKIEMFINVGVGSSANLPQFVAADYFSGQIENLTSNTVNHVTVWRTPMRTNVTVKAVELQLAAGPGMIFTTNYATATLTTHLNGVLTNLIGTVGNNITNESSTALQVNSGTLTISPGNLSNLVNNTTIDFQPGNIVTNVIAQKWNIWTNYVNTVSNFLFSFNTNRYELKNQTNIIFTNLVEEATAVGADLSVHIHNTTGVTMGIVWPAYGAQHGYFFQTNVNNPILTTTTLASGAHGVASFTAFGTNIFATFTTWP